MKGLLLACIIGVTLCNENQDQDLDQRILKCQIKDKDEASRLGSLDIWSVDTNNKKLIIRVKDENEEQLARSVGNCTVVPKKLPQPEHHSKIPGTPSTIGVVSGASAPTILSYKEMRNLLEKWADESPIATFIPSIGKSIEGRNLFAFKISSGEAYNSKKRGLWFNSGLHAREWIGPIATIYIIRSLLDDANKPRVKGLLNHFDFHFTPLANPDGYEFSRTPGNRIWRKNRRHNYDGTYGVDLNRNWNDHWGLVGSSNDTNSDGYQGITPNSEPEVQALAKYALRIPNRYAGIDFHSYGQYIMYNWGWTTKRSSNDQLLKPLGQVMKDAFKTKGYDFTVQSSADLYPASGALDDWMGAKAKMVAFTIELCPTPDHEDGFTLPVKETTNCSSGAYAAVLAFADYLNKHSAIPPERF